MHDYVSILLMAALPISELRGAIPAALISFQFSPAQAYVTSVIGNIIPAAMLLWLMPRAFDRAAGKIALARKIADWYFAKLETQNAAKIKKWGAFALLLFVAVPLPFTGAWSGAILAFLFRIPFWKAFFPISGGVLIAGALVTVGALGALRFL